MPVVDINCDMGEGAGNDAMIMPYISSANIACGYHAGDEHSMWNTIELAAKNNVAIGAHISFPDKQNFGRTEMDIPVSEVYDLVTRQLVSINEIAETLDQTIHHVKPHGALYNMSATNKDLAHIIARAVRDFDRRLLLVGLCGSYSISEAAGIGINTVQEAFADRRYRDDGNLVSRSNANALINDEKEMVKQVLQIVLEGRVTTANGGVIALKADTICIHGDGRHAIKFAKYIHQTLTMQGIEIKRVNK